MAWARVTMMGGVEKQLVLGGLQSLGSRESYLSSLNLNFLRSTVEIIKPTSQGICKVVAKHLLAPQWQFPCHSPALEASAWPLP